MTFTEVQAIALRGASAPLITLREWRDPIYHPRDCGVEIDHLSEAIVTVTLRFDPRSPVQIRDEACRGALAELERFAPLGFRYCVTWETIRS